MRQLERGGSISPESLVVNYLEGYDQTVSLDRVRTKMSGIFVCWTIDFFQSLPTVEKNKIGKTAKEFYFSEVEVQASLAYYDRNREVIDARILSNKFYYDSSIASIDEVRYAETILTEAIGKSDPLLLFDSSKF